LQCAERALQYAKTNGRGRVELHDAKMRRATEGRLQLLADLRHAIAANTLELHYQPIVRADNHIVGVEALLRWSHPQLGRVSPAEVIQLAEENGVMPALGRWILNRACVDIATIPDPHAADLHVAVNLSTRQLADPTIVNTVEEALAGSGLPAKRLMLEVTETSVIADPESTSPRLHALRNLGVRIALDDFGTGYSSLTHLRRFPIDTIKIDRSFVAGMGGNSEDFAIVASLISLAATVGLDVIAEGVETDDQAEMLRRLGCAYAQGFLWSPAVPIGELRPHLRTPACTPDLRATRSRDTRQPPDETSQVRYQDRARIQALHRAGASARAIASTLNSDGRRTPRGKRWSHSTVACVIAENAHLAFAFPRNVQFASKRRPGGAPRSNQRVPQENSPHSSLDACR
jgi:EAL domain-containing protein (putative c-di-GMP-specific phosphodiesterase class I)